jgi:hypothetical protein
MLPRREPTEYELARIGQLVAMSESDLKECRAVLGAECKKYVLAGWIDPAEHPNIAAMLDRAEQRLVDFKEELLPMVSPERRRIMRGECQARRTQLFQGKWARLARTRRVHSHQLPSRYSRVPRRPRARTRSASRRASGIRTGSDPGGDGGDGEPAGVDAPRSGRQQAGRPRTKPRLVGEIVADWIDCLEVLRARCESARSTGVEA